MKEPVLINNNPNIYKFKDFYYIPSVGYIYEKELSVKHFERLKHKDESKTINFKKGDSVQVNPEYYDDIKKNLVNDVIKKSVSTDGKLFGIIQGSHTNPGDLKPVSYQVKFFLGPNDEYTYSLFPFMLSPLEPQTPLQEARLKLQLKTEEQREIEGAIKFIDFNQLIV